MSKDLGEANEALDKMLNNRPMVQTIDDIYLWGLERGITTENGATPGSQMRKLQEELDELQEGINKGDLDKVRDSIGDMYVVLQQVARLSGLTMYECLEAAWNDIKDRKGQMMHGVFVKQADIDLCEEFREGWLKVASSAAQVREIIDEAKQYKAAAEGRIEE